MDQKITGLKPVPPKSGTREQNGVRAILRFSLGAGVTPAEGSVKPTAGFTYNQLV
jgi:hypothetical protein